jgi:hypothetical protein
MVFFFCSVKTSTLFKSNPKLLTAALDSPLGQVASGVPSHVLSSFFFSFFCDAHSDRSVQLPLPLLHQLLPSLPIQSQISSGSGLFNGFQHESHEAHR